MQPSSLVENLFFTTVRIVAEVNGKTLLGTGFYYNIQHSSGYNATLLVTNKHMVQGASTGSIYYLEANGEKVKLGTGVRMPLTEFEQGWTGHPIAEVDVAVMPFPLDFIAREHAMIPFVRAITEKNLPTQQQFTQIDAIEEVVFLGYPSGLYDAKNLTPIARRGTTATPINLDYNGLKAFLIDASVFPGSSGSPVFLYNSGSFVTRQGEVAMGTRLFFIGILSTGYYRKEQFAVEQRQADQVVGVSQMLNLGMVFRAETVKETVDEFVRLHPPPAKPPK